MSQAGQFDSTTVLADIETITGNSGGAVGPDGAGNVTLVGDGTEVTVTGNPGTNTLTITVADTFATSYPTDSGTAIPAANVLTIAGGNNVTTSGAASTVTIAVDSNVADSFPTDSGTATPAAGVLTIAGGTGITTSGAASTVTVTLDTPVSVGNGGSGRGSSTAYAVICGGTTLSNPHQSIASVGNVGQVLTSNGGGALPTFQDAAGGGITWSVETGATKAMAVNEGYFSDRTGATLAFTLPATAAVGDTMEIAQMEAGQLWTLAQNAGQTCYIGTSSTITGVGGSLAATADGDWIEIVCRVADTDFQVNVKSGNITVV